MTSKREASKKKPGLLPKIAERLKALMKLVQVLSGVVSEAVEDFDILTKQISELAKDKNGFVLRFKEFMSAELKNLVNEAVVQIPELVEEDVPSVQEVVETGAVVNEKISLEIADASEAVIENKFNANDRAPDTFYEQVERQKEATEGGRNFDEKDFGLDTGQLLGTEFSSQETVPTTEEKDKWENCLKRWKKVYEKFFRPAIVSGYIDAKYTLKENGEIDVDMSEFKFFRAEIKDKDGKVSKTLPEYNFMIPMIKGTTLRAILNVYLKLIPYVPIPGGMPGIAEFFEKVDNILSPRNAEYESYISLIIEGKGEKFTVFKKEEDSEPRGCRTVEELLMLDLLRLCEAIEADGMEFDKYNASLFNNIVKSNKTDRLGADDFVLCLNYFLDGNGNKEAIVSYLRHERLLSLKPVIINREKIFNSKYLRMFKAYRVYTKPHLHLKMEIVYAKDEEEILDFE